MKNNIYAVHGTSLQNAISIYKNGYFQKEKTWNISTNLCYAFLLNKNIDTAFQQAFRQGLAASYRYKNSCRSAVIVLDISNIEYINDNIGIVGSSLESIGILPSQVKNNIVEIYYSTNNMCWARLMGVFRLKKSHTLNKSAISLSKKEQKLCDSFDSAKLSIESCKSRIKSLISLGNHNINFPDEVDL